jgi:hypothetical protein
MLSHYTNDAFYFCGGSRIRTNDTRPFLPLLYQLSYSLFCVKGGFRSHYLLVHNQTLSLLSYIHRVVEKTGYDPVPTDFQSAAMTTSATSPFGCMTGNDPAIFTITE